MPVAETTLLPTPDRITIARFTGPRPSRAAANLFRVARYVERAEAALRLIRALVNGVGDSDEAATRVVGQICSLLGARDAVPTDLPYRRPVLVAFAGLQSRELDGALPYLVGAAQTAASVIRDRFSPDAWRALTDLSELIDAAIDPPTESAIFERTNGALRIIASFSGLAQENMSQLAGWRFLELGRRIERAVATCRFVRQFALGNLDGALDLLLELADSQITYRLRYVMVAAAAPVIDLVGLDPNNPPSVASHLHPTHTPLPPLPHP